ncbi:tRNA N(3)-cytidine methyltransferase METTL6-like [Convolutriloba macropyga]|uniref:tRNA N(3)-cytidine methyltransferase METTL6-like n=1 Tax=Convolutriloba macropyga TaxID=536237 RepID=UPI003F51DA79
MNPDDSSFSVPRELSSVELEKLSAQKETLTSSKVALLDKNAAKFWDIFYKNNSTNFFKDRHWLFREFEPLQLLANDDHEKVFFLEVGCGVGNAFFPVMEQSSKNTYGVACDFSQRAINFVLQNEQFRSENMSAFVCDIVTESLEDKLHDFNSQIDVATLLFVLSALEPDSVSKAIRNVASVLKASGKVCFRDYAVNDHAMIRFGPRNHKIKDRFYVRQDNTRAYFFYLEELELLFREGGFKAEKIEYKESKTENREKNLSVDRYFVQAVFVKL